MARTNRNLTIVSVTKGEMHAWKYLNTMGKAAHELGADFIVAMDGFFASPYLKYGRPVYVKSEGYIESVLDEVMQKVNTDYVLRLDDDECLSVSLLEWLATGEYNQQDIWSFPRAHMWTQTHFINEAPLFPDQQTRLTKKEYALGWVSNTIHHGCPHGIGKTAPYVIVHDKFLVKDYAQRKALAEHYETIKTGGGLGVNYKPFGLPEDVFEKAHLWPLEDGHVSNWATLAGRGEIWRDQH
jgi:hypothetical protein